MTLTKIEPLEASELKLLQLAIEGEAKLGRWHLRAKWRTPFVARLVLTIVQLQKRIKYAEDNCYFNQFHGPSHGVCGCGHGASNAEELES